MASGSRGAGKRRQSARREIAPGNVSPQLYPVPRSKRHESHDVSRSREMVLPVLENQRSCIVRKRQNAGEPNYLGNPCSDRPETRDGRSACDVIKVALHRPNIGRGGGGNV